MDCATALEAIPQQAMMEASDITLYFIFIRFYRVLAKYYFG